MKFSEQAEKYLRDEAMAAQLAELTAELMRRRSRFLTALQVLDRRQLGASALAESIREALQRVEQSIARAEQARGRLMGSSETLIIHGIVRGMPV